MKPPFFTIIIATFNAGRTISRAVESVLDQQWTDLEIVIQDGGSVDNTLDIVWEISKADPRLRYFSEPDKGVYDALNKGIGHAKGEWLYFLGADDYLQENTVLSAVQEAIMVRSAEIVYGNVWYEAYNRLYDGKFSISKLLTRNICHQGIFYKADIFKKLGSFNLSYKTEADYDFNLRCWLIGVKTKFIPVNIAFYSAGGKSHAERDALLVANYPFITSSYLLQGRLSKGSVILNLAAVFRKTLLRYSLQKLVAVVREKNHYPEKLMALLWMLLTLPFYFLASLFRVKK
jgi:glycosyltransferase involved in cell wall biosynthesis